MIYSRLEHRYVADQCVMMWVKTHSRWEKDIGQLSLSCGNSERMTEMNYFIQCARSLKNSFLTRNWSSHGTSKTRTSGRRKTYVIDIAEKNLIFGFLRYPSSRFRCAHVLEPEQSIQESEAELFLVGQIFVDISDSLAGEHSVMWFCC